MNHHHSSAKFATSMLLHRLYIPFISSVSNKKLPVLIAANLLAGVVISQDTLSYTQHEEATVVTATRTERKLSNSIVPVTLISQQQIQKSGTLRLNDILQEQTGVFITGGTGRNAVGGGIFGNGLQLQGLSPDHTLVLIDGEPVIGRQGGTLDLSRFTTGNIKKIEVINGPSSSLYGSEAMGGVVNIITEPAKGNSFGAQLRYGSFHTSDISTQAHWNIKKTGVYLFANRNASKGYDLDKTTVEKSADPWYSYTGQVKLNHHFSDKTRFLFNTRYYFSNQQSAFAINSSKINITGNGRTKDMFLNPVFDHRFSKKLTSSLRLSASFYSYAQQLDSLVNNKNYYSDHFAQSLLRAENVTEYHLSEKQTITAGGGYTQVQVNTTRYAGKKTQQVLHSFLQHEWNPDASLQLISGLRYDHYNTFSGTISPKLAIRYQPLKKLLFRFSAGRGFKSPDFRQLYLNFVNNAADGYVIYGTSSFSINELEQQLAGGFLARILPDAYRVKALVPESSFGLNMGMQYEPAKGTRLLVNFFRNDIQNLVNYISVAQKPNGSNVFSYINLNRAFTQGFTSDLSINCTPAINIAAGYQYLLTGDKDIFRAVKEGKVYGRDYAGGPARLLTLKDYGGLNNRSKHMAHVKLFYESPKKGWGGSLRAIYRSRWGVYDNDGNGFANQDAEFAKGFVQLNMAVSVKPLTHWQVQAGINNILDHTDAVYLPNMPGMNGFITLVYSFKN
jgi:outer membrane receptor for ferrienterochelin and colicins